MPPLSKVTVTSIDDDPVTYEAKHVHAVYEQIASHFSLTRYKPWPIVDAFISGLPTGWVGLDSGTGNGKNLSLPAERPGAVWTIGLDRSSNLLTAARTAGSDGHATMREVVLSDILGRGWRRGAFDYAISIATIHHLATRDRRRDAVERLLESVSSTHGRVLVYVWAIEQDYMSKRSIPQENETTQTGNGQDVFVPWVLSETTQQKTSKRRREKSATAITEAVQPTEPKTFNRYYHMFAEGELLRLVEDAAHGMDLRIGPPHTDIPRGTMGVEVVQSGWERSNYYVEMRRWEAR